MQALTCLCCCSYSCCNWLEATYWQDVERNEESDIKTLNKLLNWVSSSHFKHLNNKINKCTIYLDSQRMWTRSSISFLSMAKTTHVFSQNRAQALIHQPWRFICCCLWVLCNCHNWINSGTIGSTATYFFLPNASSQPSSFVLLSWFRSLSSGPLNRSRKESCLSVTGVPLSDAQFHSIKKK